ncbi:MAG: DsbA family protein [Anaerolineae bacterium]
MKQSRSETARQVVVTVNRRAGRWLGALVVMVAMLGLGIWIRRSVSQVDPGTFNPYATSVPPASRLSPAPGVATPAAQAATRAPALLPPPRRDFKPEPEDFAVKGDPDAPITIVEYSDYQCPWCGRHAREVLPLLDVAYVRTGKVRYIYKDFVIFGPLSERVSQLAECAGEQGLYWPMHDWLFRAQRAWVRRPNPEQIILDGAAELGLDAEALKGCTDSGKYLAEVRADTDEAGRAGGRGTPAFMVNGRLLTGFQPWERFQAVIEQLLAEKGAGK